MSPVPAVGRIEVWEGRPVAGWAALWGVPALHAYDAVESTNDVARALAQAGAPAGTIVLADHQTRGRGQHGRGWHAPAGKAVLLSAVLRPTLPVTERAPAALSIRVGLAAARALERGTGVPIGLKWPNDLVAHGAKLGGILVEAAMAGESFYAVVGIGLNVLQVPEDFPSDLDAPAVSLAMIRAGPVARASVAEALARALVGLATAPADPLSPAELREYARRDILRHRAITIDGSPAGLALGLDADGALRVEQPDGSITSYRGGTVRAASRTSGTGP
jgi:BirA family biotin operon repressor/biotin-[acetyl-CoA-carboxylase] ligase